MTIIQQLKYVSSTVNKLIDWGPLGFIVLLLAIIGIILITGIWVYNKTNNNPLRFGSNSHIDWCKKWYRILTRYAFIDMEIELRRAFAENHFDKPGTLLWEQTVSDRFEYDWATAWKRFDEGYNPIFILTIANRRNKMDASKESMKCLYRSIFMFWDELKRDKSLTELSRQRKIMQDVRRHIEVIVNDIANSYAKDLDENYNKKKG